MVKRQKEKQYLSAREHRSHQGLRSGTSSSVVGTTSTTTRRLPFDCCALTLTPYVDPVCTPNGVVFEGSAIVPYLMKHGVDPVTGTKMTSRDLIRLNMDKDEGGKWQCPVLCKPFGDRTAVVAVVQRPPGNEANVYSREAVRELNFKTKNFEDLTSGKKFHRTRDVITLQDADDAEHCRLRDIDNFVHMKERRSIAGGAEGTTSKVRHSVTAGRVMETLKRKREEEAERDRKKREAEAKRNENNPKGEKRRKVYAADLLGVELTTGKASASLTSTSLSYVPRGGENDMREATEEEVRESMFRALRKLKKKGFVRLQTNMGVIDLEIHCDMVPQTSANFLSLVEAGKYNGSSFHRSIKNFMIQGGKPHSKTEKDDCFWGGSFPDEFDDRLKHEGPGVLSMANAGPGTNRRQFFITYKSCGHLDRKHSIFGRVVAGMEVLKAMESITTDKKDKPRDEIKIINAEIMGPNLIHEAEKIEEKRIEECAAKRRKEKEERKASALGRDTSARKSSSGGERTGGLAPLKGNQGDVTKAGAAVGVGKYLPKGALRSFEEEGPGSVGHMVKKESNVAANPPAPSRMPKAPKRTVFADFSGW